MQVVASRGIAWNELSMQRVSSPREESGNSTFYQTHGQRHTQQLYMHFRLHRMHEMLTILTDVLFAVSVTRLKLVAARAAYTACRVRGVI